MKINTQHILSYMQKYLKNMVLRSLTCPTYWRGGSQSVFLVVHGGLRCQMWWLACRRFTLVTFCKQSKCINLFDEIAHTGPSTKPKPNNQNPAHNKNVNNIHDSPAWHEGWWLFCCILQNYLFIYVKTNYKI